MLHDQYDRQGNPISFWRWGELHADPEYKLVASDDVGPYWVSTVWMGLNHNFAGGPPIIFETMVFSRDQRDDPEEHGLTDISCERYCTEEEAKQGHAEMVTLVRSTLIEEIPDA